jgi:type IV pilus assembly protein PilE
MKQSQMFKQCTARSAKSAGFTLVELMVTLVIAAILMTVAIPAYNSQVRKSRRTEAKTALLDLAGREERLYSTTNLYSSTPSDLGYGAAGATFPMTVGSGYYTVNVTNLVNNVVAGQQSTYRVVATPVAGKGQDLDTQCLTFSIDQTGNQQATTANCWK